MKYIIAFPTFAMVGMSSAVYIFSESVNYSQIMMSNDENIVKEPFVNDNIVLELHDTVTTNSVNSSLFNKINNSIKEKRKCDSITNCKEEDFLKLATELETMHSDLLFLNKQKNRWAKAYKKYLKSPNKNFNSTNDRYAKFTEINTKYHNLHDKYEDWFKQINNFYNFMKPENQLIPITKQNHDLWLQIKNFIKDKKIEDFDNFRLQLRHQKIWSS